MYTRLLYRKLLKWKEKNSRKPLILRGARQVGKTTLVNMFSKEFDFFIPLNLEHEDDRNIFNNHDDVQTVIQLLFLRQGIRTDTNKSVLLFIDEIQNSTKAVSLLRYFFEKAKAIHVIAAGSLLESLLGNHINFPVGRVEYLLLRPFCFEEYLMAAEQGQLHEAFLEDSFPEFAHSQMLKLFSEFTLIGGMPEIVGQYLKNRDIVSMNPIFEGLIVTYLEDVEKYAGTATQKNIIRHIIENAFYFAGERIKFEGFAASNYKSKDVGECFRLLEKTFLLSIVYPTTQTKLPLIVNKRKSPKLHVLDTGIINWYVGIQADLINNKEINSVYEGKVAEHIVGQELLTKNNSVLAKNVFWVKEKKQSNAEVDYVINHHGMLIPVEVKSGKTGRLRSLMEFVDASPHQFAVRIYSDKLKIDKTATLKGKDFYLLNLPFYLTGQIEKYIKMLLKIND